MRFVLVVLAFTFILLMLTSSAWAEAVNFQDPTSILAWLKLQGIGASIILTIIWKYVPGLRNLSNRVFLPWLSLVMFVVMQLAGVQPAIADAGSAVAVAKPSTVQAIAIGVVNSQVTKVLWDGWLKPTIGSLFDRWFRRKEQTPVFHG